MLFGIAAFGVVLRLRHYVFARSLWHDEATLANNIVERSLVRLIAEPLDSAQVAPIGFLALSKMITALFGNNEMVLRLLPFAAGLGSLVLAVLIARRVFTTGIARLAFVSFMSFAPVLIYYSNEVKQYGVDVFVAMLGLWVALSYSKWRRGVLWLTITGALIVWFSHATVFVVAGIGLGLGWRWVRERRSSTLATVGLAWAGSAGLMLAVTPRAESTLQFMQEFHEASFAPFPPASLTDLMWYPSAAAHLVSFAWRETLVLSDYRTTRLALLGFAVMGSIALIRVRAALPIVILAPIAFLMIASAMRLYPFRGRLALFLVPIVFLLTAVVLEWNASRGPPRLRWLTGPIAFVLVASIMLPAIEELPQPRRGEDIRSSLAFLVEGWRPGDGLMLSDGSEPAYRYYTDRYQLGSIEVAGLLSQPLEVGCFLAQLPPAEGLARAWFLFSHEMKEVPPFVEGVSAVALQLESRESSGSALYLFDLSDISGVKETECVATAN